MDEKRTFFYFDSMQFYTQEQQKSKIERRATG
jgi:hypothetical protein